LTGGYSAPFVLPDYIARIRFALYVDITNQYIPIVHADDSFPNGIRAHGSSDYEMLEMEF